MERRNSIGHGDTETCRALRQIGKACEAAPAIIADMENRRLNIDRSGEIATVMFNRPEVTNALRSPISRPWRQILAEARNAGSMSESGLACAKTLTEAQRAQHWFTIAITDAQHRPKCRLWVTSRLYCYLAGTSEPGK